MSTKLLPAPSADDLDNQPAGGIFKNAALEVLKAEERLMTSGEITKLALERGLLKATGKTPENTMASALYTEVRRKSGNTPFIKPKEGLFGLKAWLNEPWLLNWLEQENISVTDLDDGEPIPKLQPVPREAKRPRTTGSGTDKPTLKSVRSGPSDDLSNLNLLLEAAAEMDSEEEREESPVEELPPKRRALPEGQRGPRVSSSGGAEDFDDLQLLGRAGGPLSPQAFLAAALGAALNGGPGNLGAIAQLQAIQQLGLAGLGIPGNPLQAMQAMNSLISLTGAQNMAMQPGGLQLLGLLSAQAGTPLLAALAGQLVQQGMPPPPGLLAALLSGNLPVGLNPASGPLPHPALALPSPKASSSANVAVESILNSFKGAVAAASAREAAGEPPLPGQTLAPHPSASQAPVSFPINEALVGKVPISQPPLSQPLVAISQPYPAASQPVIGTSVAAVIPPSATSIPKTQSTAVEHMASAAIPRAMPPPNSVPQITDKPPQVSGPTAIPPSSLPLMPPTILPQPLVITSAPTPTLTSLPLPAGVAVAVSLPAAVSLSLPLKVDALKVEIPNQIAAPIIPVSLPAVPKQDVVASTQSTEAKPQPAVPPATSQAAVPVQNNQTLPQATQSATPGLLSAVTPPITSTALAAPAPVSAGLPARLPASLAMPPPPPISLAMPPASSVPSPLPSSMAMARVTPAPEQNGTALLPSVPPELSALLTNGIAALRGDASDPSHELPPVEAAKPGDLVEPEPVNRIRATVLDTEQRLGPLHPETGKAYVLLARVLEHRSTPWSLEMAERALLRAWRVIIATSAADLMKASVPNGPTTQQSDGSQPTNIAAAVAAQQLADSFNHFKYLMDQIRFKQSLLAMQNHVAVQAAAAVTTGGASGPLSPTAAFQALTTAASTAPNLNIPDQLMQPLAAVGLAAIAAASVNVANPPIAGPSAAGGTPTPANFQPSSTPPLPQPPMIPTLPPVPHAQPPLPLPPPSPLSLLQQLAQQVQQGGNPMLPPPLLDGPPGLPPLPPVALLAALAQLGLPGGPAGPKP